MLGPAGLGAGASGLVLGPDGLAGASGLVLGPDGLAGASGLVLGPGGAMAGVCAGAMAGAGMVARPPGPARFSFT